MLENTNSARFNDPKQKPIYAQYLDQWVIIEHCDYNPLWTVSRKTSS
jgi:hypothetical protein